MYSRQLSGLKRYSKKVQEEEGEGIMGNNCNSTQSPIKLQWVMVYAYVVLISSFFCSLLCLRRATPLPQQHPNVQ